MSVIRAVLFDIGGVLTTSPFESFTRYERDHGLPGGFIRGLNATNPDTNAWARHERNEVTLAEFCELFEAEAAAAGHTMDARAVLACIDGGVRDEMVTAVRRCRARLKTAAVTNNMGSLRAAAGARPGMMDAFADLFDVVIESSKVGVRKPDPRFYELACDALEVAPPEVVFLDDLGVNLKPARAMGMTTIKVMDADDAIRDLESVVGFSLRE